MSLNDSVSLQSTSSCSSDLENVTWPLGRDIYNTMKNQWLKGNPYHSKDGQDSFFYLFKDDGKLLDSYLSISNLRQLRRGKDIKEGSFYWDKSQFELIKLKREVGEYTNGELRMADIEWPGGRANPPQGTPDKFHVKVVTLSEPPFIIVSELDLDTGKCPGNQGVVCDWGDISVEENGVKK
uniref:Uncharacterized protein n=1 Tax=Panagrolaimus davidi TaxID=227884 RepID=A0A914PJH8_9BILA